MLVKVSIKSIKKLGKVLYVMQTTIKFTTVNIDVLIDSFGKDDDIKEKVMKRAKFKKYLKEK